MPVGIFCGICSISRRYYFVNKKNSIFYRMLLECCNPTLFEATLHFLKFFPLTFGELFFIRFS